MLVFFFFFFIIHDTPFQSQERGQARERGPDEAGGRAGHSAFPVALTRGFLPVREEGKWGVRRPPSLLSWADTPFCDLGGLTLLCLMSSSPK